MSTDGEYADPAAGGKNPLRSDGVQEHKGNASETPAPTSPAPIVAILERLGRIINHQLKRMENGEIDQLSDQHNSMLQQLASMSVSGSSSAALSETDPSTPLPVQPVPTYAGVLSAPKAVTFTPNDVRSLPRLTGSADVDVAEVLSQFRLVVGFRAKAVAPHDEKFADNLAFEHLSLICDGHCVARLDAGMQTPSFFFVLFVSQSADFWLCKRLSRFSSHFSLSNCLCASTPCCTQPSCCTAVCCVRG